MNRLYVGAACVALLSAISFPATAVMFGAAPNANIQARSISVSPEPLALSPEGKPVRVISLQGSASAAQPDAPGLSISSPPQRPEVKPALPSEQPAAVAFEPPKVAPSAPKHVASARRPTRSAATPVKSLVALSSLY
jgi:hypothetical protein